MDEQENYAFAMALELEFPRFGGHFLSYEGECRDAENKTCLPA
ncbi:MAG: hypothetical protein AAF415_03700 [Pseudomonadota bacterium]